MNSASMAGRSALLLAGEWCQRATALEPDNADAWAAASQVDTWMVYHNYDPTPARRAQAHDKAARALQIAPRSFEARLAQTCYVARAAAAPISETLAAGAERTLRELLAEKTEEPRTVFALAMLLQRAGRYDEAAVLFDRMAQHRDFASLAYNEKGWMFVLMPEPRCAAALEAAERSIALQPTWANLSLKQMLSQHWLGDLDAAVAALERAPAAGFSEDFMATMAWRLHAWRRDPAAMLRAVAALPGEWVRASPYEGPKALLTGVAHAMAGNQVAAEAAWRSGLKLVEDRLAGQPDRTALLLVKGELLTRLGDAAEAAKAFELARQITTNPLRVERYATVHGRDAQKALAHLERGMASGNFEYTAASLRLNPELDWLRREPGFAALQAKADADPRLSPKAGKMGTAAAPDPKSVVVLPFANLSGDPAQEYFSDGVTEEILNALMRERDLRVVPRTSAFSFKDKKLTLPEIARTLNVAQVVDGSVRQAGNQVRINATLTRAADGIPQPLPQFVREMKDASDIFALQEEVARAVVEKLTQRASTAGPIAVLTKNTEAWEAFLRGRDLMNQTSPSWPKAVEAFRRAVDLDPKFAMAWAKLGQLSAALYAYGFDGKALAESERALREALRLGPDLREVHLAQAFFLRATGAAPAAIERALAAAGKDRADDPAVLQIRGEILLALGNDEEGIRALQRAAIVDARNGSVLNMLGNALTASGRYEEAETVYRQAFEILRSSIPWTNRASVTFHGKGDIALATRTLDEAPEEIRHERYWTSRALLLYMMGDQSGALSAAARMQQRSAFFRIRPFFTAKMREASGDAEGARRDYLEALPLAEQQRDEFAGLATPYAILALVYAGLDRKAEALEAARKAVELGRFIADPNSAAGRDGRGRTGVGALTLVDLELSSEAALAQVQARFGLIDEALAIVATNVAAGHWRRNNLLRNPDWAILRKDPRFGAIAEKAPL